MKRMLGTIVSLFITLFFMGIIIYVMTEGMHLPDKEAWGGIITFTVIEFLILLVVIGFGKFISGALGTGLYAPLCTVTVFYAILGTALNLILSGNSSFVVILTNLILLFVYAAIALPITVKGVNSKGGDFPVDPANPNNMPTSAFLNKGVNNNAALKQTIQQPQAPVQAQTAAVAFCPECGQKIPAGTKFCTACGKQIDKQLSFVNK